MAEFLASDQAMMPIAMVRESSGEGQEIEVPMFETLNAFTMTEHLGGSLFEPPIGPTGYARALAAERRPYATRDGYVTAMIYTHRHWQAFFAAIGNPDAAVTARDAEIVDMSFAIGSWIAFGRLTHALELDTVCMPTMPQVW